MTFLFVTYPAKCLDGLHIADNVSYVPGHKVAGRFPRIDQFFTSSNQRYRNRYGYTDQPNQHQSQPRREPPQDITCKEQWNNIGYDVKHDRVIKHLKSTSISQHFFGE